MSSLQPSSKEYTPTYFDAQIRKSDAKVVWQYGRIFSLAGIQDVRGLRIVDVGCGAGPGLRYLVGRGAIALGLDHSRYALEIARHLAPNAAVVLSNGAVGLPCASRSADVLLLSELVEHLQDALPLLKECYRVLVPGGYVIVTTPNLWDSRRLTAPLTGKVWSGYTDPTHVNLYTPLRLARELRTAGFGAVFWYTGVKPVLWLSSKRLRLRLPIPYPPLIGNGLLAVGRRV